MKKILLVLIVFSVFVLAGCNDPKFSFDIDTRRITIITDPPGANVRQLGVMWCQSSENLGASPLIDQPVIVIKKITKSRNLSYHQASSLFKAVGNIRVQVSKEGYETYTTYLKTDPGKTMEYTIKLLKKED